MFIEFKKQVQEKFLALQERGLFYVSVDRDAIVEVYLGAFSEEDRQSNNCNCCKSFLRQYGGIVTIDENFNTVSIWDLEDVTEEYKASAKALSDYIHSLPVTDVFLTDTVKAGTDKSFDPTRDIYWNHLSLVVPNQYKTSSDKIASILGSTSTTSSMLWRGLTELTVDATLTVLELISSNSLYKGKEFEDLLNKWLAVQNDYLSVCTLQPLSNYFIYHASKLPMNVSRIRNSAIGTLLISLSEGMEINDAVAKYENLVSAGSYKRSSAIATPSMIKNAKAKLGSLGLLDSLERRHATEVDIDINNVLFTDRAKVSLDVFSDMLKEQPTNPNTLKGITEIGIEDFISKVIPTATSMEVLLEDVHLDKFVTLFTARFPESPSLFSWDNPFSWAYTGDITDSIKERVKAMGGRVDGDLRFSIQWNLDNKDTSIDLDAYAKDPSGNLIYYRQHSKPDMTKQGGQLDVDIRHPGDKAAVENIYWPNVRAMEDGDYTFHVNNYSSSLCKGGFSAEIEMLGEIFNFNFPPVRGYAKVSVAVVTLKNGKFTIKSETSSTNAISSKPKWNVKTNVFTKVNKIMLSPNYWGHNKGNKHFFFMLDGCAADESLRPLFNEYLKAEFHENRKVFELLGSKLSIAPGKGQLAGVGFSDTQRAHLIVRVIGKVTKVLKVLI